MTYGLLAQQAERHPVKVRVAGSIPAGKGKDIGFSSRK